MGNRKHIKIKEKVLYRPGAEDEMQNVLNANIIPLNDDLIFELTDKGISIPEMLLYRDKGLGYCRERESFMSLKWYVEGDNLFSFEVHWKNNPRTEVHVIYDAKEPPPKK